MTSLTDFYANVVPTATHEELMAYAVVFSNADALDYIAGQDTECDTKYTITRIRELKDGRFSMNATVLKEFYSKTGVYDPKFEEVILRNSDTTMVEDWAATASLFPPPVPEEEEGAIVQWVQPVPGDPNQWFDQGYPFGHRVLHTIDGTEYTMRSNIDFNVTEPVFDARYWQIYPPQSVPWALGQVWSIGDVVNHYVDDPAYPPPVSEWRSKIDGNTAEPSHDSGFYRFWEPAGEDYEPGVTEYNPARRYALGEKCIENGKTYVSIYQSLNAWAPSAYPSGWEEVVTEEPEPPE